MQRVLLKTNIFNLINCTRNKYSRNNLVSASTCRDLSTKEKEKRDNSIDRKSIYSSNIIKIIQLDNAYIIEILIICNSALANSNQTLSRYIK